MTLSEDWVKAKYTAVISDLHLCEAEPVNPHFPLWKKFKTREFFFDDVFGDFLKEIEKKAEGNPVELILNGDIFDFDSVTSLPVDPPYRIKWIEKKRGLFPRPERSEYKVERILHDHTEFFQHLAEFLKRGNKAVFVIGNHDTELHYPEVQKKILKVLHLDTENPKSVRFCEWFYLSNQDTLIEHGNQYDPYCVCEDPVHPFSKGYNFKTMRLPFGNLACRYILNGLGFFNPHVESNFIMTVPQYLSFFWRYMVRAQPLIMWTWIWSALLTIHMALRDRLILPMRDPLKFEDRIEEIAHRSNASPRAVRELRELFSDPASKNPFMMARELWLDRALLIVFSFLVAFQLMILINQVYQVSFYWAFIPLFLLFPFFLFYSQSIQSMVSGYKEPDDIILATASRITKTFRVVYGHTHIVRHEMIGAVEHLNSGCWSPAFTDVECTQAFDQKTFVWIEPDATVEGEMRRATVYRFKEGGIHEYK